MSASPERQHIRVLPANPLRAAWIMLVLLAVLYAVQIVEIQVPSLVYNGIQPRAVSGLDGILWAPLLHGGWAHLIGNTLPLFVLGWLVLAGGVRQFVAVTATVWLLGGLGTWLIASGGPHIGASGVAFGWMVFLLVRGFFLRSARQILVAVVLFFYWGGLLWGVLPGQPNISWEGHLSGALAGLLAAWLVAKSTRGATGGAAAGRLAA